MVQRTLIRPPASRLGPITPQERQQADGAKPGRRPVRQDGRSRIGVRDAAEEGQPNRPSAAEQQKQAQQQPAPQPDSGGSGWSIPGFGTGSGGRSSGRQTVAEAAIKSVVRSVGSSIGRALVRGILGSLTRR